MNKVFTSAVVIIPPEDKWGPIQDIRNLYDRQINRWMPHITLLYPFRPNSEFDALEEEFSKICQEINSFEISLKRLRSFNHGHQNFTIWLVPEPSISIVNLQSKILKLVPDCNEVTLYRRGFTPHLSVGQIKGKGYLYDLINTLQNSWSDLKFEVNSIYFISREKDKLAKFQIQKQINLHG